MIIRIKNTMNPRGFIISFTPSLAPLINIVIEPVKNSSVRNAKNIAMYLNQDQN